MSQRQRQRGVRRRRNQSARANLTARTRFIATGGAMTVAVSALAVAPAQAALPPISTAMVADLAPGGASGNIDEVTKVGSSVFFTRYVAGQGRELWKSDGTAAGTVLVKDIRPGLSGSEPEDLVAVGGSLFFSAYTPDQGRELWKSDGTAAGTVLVKDLNPATNTYYGHTYADSGRPDQLTAAGGVLYFSADDGVNGRELWKSDGTTAGTVLVADANPGAGSTEMNQLTPVGGTLFFSGQDSAGYELWSSDGTTVARFADISPGPASSSPRELTAVNGKLFFTAAPGGSGRRLSVATPGGTVTQLINTPGYSYSYDLEAVGNTLFFSGENSANGRELWKSDGTEAGTTLAVDIRSGANNSRPYQLTNVAGTLFFTADDGTPGDAEQLWRSDGTAAGTTKVKSLPYNQGGGYSYSHFDDLTAVGGTLFFTAEDATNGEELGRSDGTAAGTEVLDVRPGYYGANPSDLTAVGSTLFFTAVDGVHGRELWTARPGAANPPVAPPAPAPVQPPGPGVDKTVDGVSIRVKGTQKQKSKVNILAKVGAGEAVQAKATGSIKLGKAKKRVKITAKSVKVTAGGSGTLKLSVGKKDQAKVISAVKKYRTAVKKAGSKKAAKKVAKKLAVLATVHVDVVDNAGNVHTQQIVVKLV